MRRLLQRLTPPGASAKAELISAGASLAVSVLWGLCCLGRVSVARSQFLSYVRSGRDWYMTFTLRDLTEAAMWGFSVTALCLAALAVWNYASLRRGSRADYTMRRVKSPLELHIRCLAVPVIGILAGLLLAGILYIVYKSYYNSTLLWMDVIRRQYGIG